MQLILLWESWHAFHSLFGESSENGLYWIDCPAEFTTKYVLFFQLLIFSWLGTPFVWAWWRESSVKFSFTQVCVLSF